MRKFIYQCHSWLGLVAGLGLLVIGLTGSALVFKEEIDRVIAPELVLRPDPAAPRLAPDAFLAAVQAELPERVVIGWGRALKPELSDMVYAVKPGEEDGIMVHVDPATGKPRSADPEKSETTGDWLLKLHYTFLADHTGEFIVGFFGVLLCLLGISGVYLYRGFWKSFIRLRWGKSARIFFSDLHKMVGISSTVFNLLLGFTGAWWNLGHIIGHWVEEEAAPPVVEKWTGEVSVDAMAAAAAQRLPGYQANWITLPFTADGDVSFFGAMADDGPLRSPYGSIVSFDRKSGALKSAVLARDAGVGGQILDSFRPLHFGNFGGLPVKILWSLAGLTPAILAISGSMMWWKRTRRGCGSSK
jgi:uncharacterized iron-regulated membrane protein